MAYAKGTNIRFRGQTYFITPEDIENAAATLTPAESAWPSRGGKRKWVAVVDGQPYSIMELAAAIVGVQPQEFYHKNAPAPVRILKQLGVPIIGAEWEEVAPEEWDQVFD
jgi:hypothetical protein